MLFSGTVRSNVDPMEEAGGDEKVWEALDQAGLRPTVAAMEVRIGHRHHYCCFARGLGWEDRGRRSLACASSGLTSLLEPQR